MSRPHVCLVWDNSRAEHGEGPELVAVFASQASAQAFLHRGFDEEEREDYSIEEREVLL